MQFFFTQQRFQRLWQSAKASEILQDFAILKLSISALIVILFISLQTLCYHTSSVRIGSLFNCELEQFRIYIKECRIFGFHSVESTWF